MRYPYLNKSSYVLILLLFGLTPTILIAADYYWIGGTGNWSDLNHWATSSGGLELHNRLPGPDDNVIFNENAFNQIGAVVTIDLEAATCRSMDWSSASNGPTLAGDESNTLFVYGHLYLTQDMSIAFGGLLTFAGTTSGWEIDLAGHLFPNSILFDGAGGEWTLQNDLKVYDQLEYRQGTLMTQGYAIELQRFISTTPSPRTLLLGESEINIVSRSNNDSEIMPTFFLNPPDLTLDASSATIIFRDRPESLFSIAGSSSIIEFKKIIINSHYNRFLLGGLGNKIDSLIFNGSASFQNQGTIDYLKLSAGYTFSFSNVDYTIGELDASGDCNMGLTYLNGFQNGVTSELYIQQDFTGEYLAINGIHQQGVGMARAENSIDLGLNRNWEIEDQLSRQLFWVGNTGRWEDPQNWSITSGGAGGYCIPTAIDDVIFDENSFSAAGQRVTSDNQLRAHVRNLTFRNTPQNITLENFYLTVYQDLNLIPGIAMDVLETEFRGGATSRLETANNIFANGMVINVDRGVLQLENTLNLEKHLYFFQGDFQSNGHDIFANLIFITKGFDVLNLDDSHITLDYDDQFWALRSNTDLELQVPSTNFTMELTGASTNVQFFYDDQFGHLYFSNPDGMGEIFTENTQFRKITFNGNGAFFLSNNTTDSLIMTAGKTYTLENNFDLNINEYWEVCGTPCNPIDITTRLGSSAKANVIAPPEARLVSDYIRLENTAASGGNAFDPGDHSENVMNSNTGWAFNTQAEQTNFGMLGPDQLICETTEVILNPNLSCTNVDYGWSTGSGLDSIQVNIPGTYSLQVRFPDGCELSDTVVVDKIELNESILPLDTALCVQETLLVEAAVGNEEATYNWYDGSTEQTNNLLAPGSYFVTVNIGDCSITDSILIEGVTLPRIDLIYEDTVACQGDTLVLGIESDPENDIFWYNGSQEKEVQVTQDGNYWVEVRDDQCLNQAAISVRFETVPTLDLGPDTITGCLTSGLTLTTDLPGNYLWQDDSKNKSFTIQENGFYYLLVDDGICQVSDTVFVSLIDCSAPEVFIPNIFSPDGDGINDDFRIEPSPNYTILQYRLTIFDRWGNLIFTSEQPQTNWNGQVGGQPAENGTYVYQLELEYQDQVGVREALLSGSVLVVR